MKQVFSGLNLIMGSIITLFVLGSSVEAVPADASWAVWGTFWAIAALAVAVGLQGARDLDC